MILRVFLLFISIILLTLNTSCERLSAKSNTLIQTDSLSILLSQLENSSLSNSDKKNLVKKAYSLLTFEKNDSVKIKQLLTLSLKSFRLKDSMFFKKINRETYVLAMEKGDTSAMAETYWNYGSFYNSFGVMDSSYYHYNKAQELFSAVNNDFYAAKMLYNMAFIQGRIKNHTASEVLTFKAIAIYEPLGENLSLYRCYNHLGLIFNELKEYEKAIFYFSEASSYLKKVKDKKTFPEGLLNNQSLIYQKLGRYDEAIELLNKALKNKNLKAQNSRLYAMILDNLTYTNFLMGDSTDLSLEFQESLEIRDSIKSMSGILMSKLHLAEYYHARANQIEAIKNAKEAYQIALTIDNNRDQLTALTLLGKIDVENSNTYLEERIRLSDSLHAEERKIRDKFTRIQFETAGLEAKTKQLSSERNNILIVSSFAVSILLLLLYIRMQKTRNKELIFDKIQQNSNEEIYDLMLKQQSKLQEGKMQERTRISEELHDGVLGKLYGTRLSLGFLGLKGDDSTIHKYNTHIEELQLIEKEVRNISHELKNDLLSSKLNFISIIEELIIKQSELGGFSYDLDCNESIYWDEIEEKIKINLYRIIQESMQNILKYADASIVNINFDFKEPYIILTIEDNGLGFVLKRKNKGIGLKNILSRSEALGGTSEVQSTVGKGSIIKVIIPIATD